MVLRNYESFLVFTMKSCPVNCRINGRPDLVCNIE